MKNLIVIALLNLLFFSVASANLGVTYHGRIIKTNNEPVEGPVKFRIQIFSPSADRCLMYQEEQTQTVSDGVFSLTIGSGQRVDSQVDGGYSFDRIFANRGTFSFASTSPSACLFGSSYSPNSADSRLVKVHFNDGSGWDTMPEQFLSWTPFAITSHSVGGFTKEELLRVEGGTAPAFSVNDFQTLQEIIQGTSSLYTTPSAVTNAIGNLGPLASMSTTGTPSSTTYLRGDGQWASISGSGDGTVTEVRGTANQITVTNGTSTPTVSLATTSVTTGTYGATNKTINSISVDAFGRITGISDSLISLNANQITVGSLDIAQGGTGANTKTVAFNNLSPLSTKGDLIAFDGSNNIRLPAAAGNNKYLRTNSATATGLEYGDVSASELSSITSTGIVSRTGPGAYSALGLTAPLTNSGTALGLAIGNGLTTSAGNLVVNTGNGASQIPQLDGNGKLNASVIPSTAGANPAGSSTEIQFRSNATTFGSHHNFVWGTSAAGPGLGIGIATPRATLNVVGSRAILLGNWAGGTGMNQHTSISHAPSSSTDSLLQKPFTMIAANAFLDRSEILIGGSTHHDEESVKYIRFFTDPDRNMLKGKERMTIAPDGRVGIGAPNPQTTLQVAGIISPSADNTYSLGNATYRFTEVFAKNGTVNTSDRREKKDIRETNLGLDFILNLRPVSYQWNTGVDNVTHYGLIAQETENTLQKTLGQPNKTSIVTYDKSSDRYGVRYSELIAPLIKSAQELYKKITLQDEQIRSQNRHIASLAKEKVDRSELEVLQNQNELLRLENQNIKNYLCQKDPAAPFCK